MERYAGCATIVVSLTHAVSSGSLGTIGADAKELAPVFALRKRD